jgi:uncharacterized membrane protein YfcA
VELTDTSQSGPEASTVSQNIVSKRFRYFSPWLVLLTAAWCVIYFGMFPDPVGLAARNWPLVFVGVCGAVIGNITAIGGGLVFIPVLMFAYSTDPVSALKLTFVTQAVGMTSGATGWLSRGEVPVRLLKWTVPTLVLGALISSFLIRPNPMLVKGLFGPVTIIAGVLTLLTMHRRGGLPDLPPGANWPVAAMSLLGGLVTGWVAVGEGEIIAAFCMLVYHLSPNRALGLGVTLLAINSIFLALVHGIFLGGVPWNMAIFTALGVLWGGRLGPFLAQWISTRMAKKIFAVVAILNGLLILFQVFGILGWLKKL